MRRHELKIDLQIYTIILLKYVLGLNTCSVVSGDVSICAYRLKARVEVGGSTEGAFHDIYVVQWRINNGSEYTLVVRVQ